MRSAAGRPKVHTHLSREAIASAGLALIDRRGPEALTLRNLAVELGVGTTTLYGHVRSKEEIVLDIVALLFAEIESSPRLGEGWGLWMRRMAASIREMALRHPHAFPLYATAPDDRPPVLDFAREFMSLSRSHDVAEEQAVVAWQVIGGYTTGFLLQEAAEMVRTLVKTPAVVVETLPPDPLRERMARVHTAEAFAAGLEVVLSGLRQTQGIPD